MVKKAFSSRSQPNAVIACALLLLGSVTMLGWLLHVPAMVEIVHGLVPMVFNTGLCFALTGIGMLLPSRSRAPAVRAVIGWFLIALCSLTLTEHIASISLGIDMAWVHAWYDYGNTRPGRMAPNTAIGFMLIGAIYARLRRVDSPHAAYTVVIVTFCVLTIGLTGLVGYLLAPDLLFGWSRSARMAVHTASGMILAGIGIWMGWARSEWFSSSRFFTEAAKVRLLGTAIMVVVTTTVGLTGFVLMQKSLEQAIEGRLVAVLESRTSLLKTLTQQTVQRARTDLRLAEAPAAALPLLQSPSVAANPAFAKVSQRLLAEGYAHIALEDTQGRTVQENGALAAPIQFQTQIDNDGSQLLWNGQLMVIVREQLLQSGRSVGYLRLARTVQLFHASLFEMDKLGDTAEIAACVAQVGQLVCLPNNRNVKVFKIDLRQRGTTRKLPMEYAIAGKTGIVYTVDYRQHNVVAAYKPVYPGFGFVAKQDTVEAYSVIRHALEFGAPIIVVISLLGAFALYSQMDPLVTRMYLSERNAEQAAAETRSLMAAVGEGILTIDGSGCMRAINPAACKIFGYELHELSGQNMSLLVPPEQRHAHQKGLAAATAGAPPRLVGMPSVKVHGLRKDGTMFPLELTITAVMVGTEKWFVGVMRDITERLELENKLERLAQYDSLTGLANRSLFRERLRLALKRSERSEHAVAVMFIDLDGFKCVNDTMGHHAGDQLLVEIARRMLTTVRSTDTVARLGGDEFTVILEDVKVPAQHAVRVAHKIMAEIRTPVCLAGKSASVSASVGLVIHEAGENITEASMELILRLADERMYAAKQAGKNRLVAS